MCVLLEGHENFSRNPYYESLAQFMIPTVFVHLQLHTGEHARLALSHLQFVLSPLQEHFISSLHAFDTSGIVIQTGCHDVDEVFVQANSLVNGITCCI